MLLKYIAPTLRYVTALKYALQLCHEPSGTPIALERLSLCFDQTSASKQLQENTLLSLLVLPFLNYSF